MPKELEDWPSGALLLTPDGVDPGAACAAIALLVPRDGLLPASLRFLAPPSQVWGVGCGQPCGRARSRVRGVEERGEGTSSLGSEVHGAGGPAALELRWLTHPDVRRRLAERYERGLLGLPAE